MLDELTRALDGGAQGVLVARIETAAEARAVVEACRYAPTGRRSWGAGFAQANAGPVAAAIEHAEENATVIAMIESAKGLKNAGAIAAQRGIDALFVGILDLSIDLGVPGRYQDAAVTGAFETVGRAAAAAGAAFGFGGVSDPAWERWALGLGARLLVGGSDQGFMMAGATHRARAIRDMEHAPR
jgi:2-keto-3-deoxy-L-rhamnonate aldolase RhmA